MNSALLVLVVRIAIARTQEQFQARAIIAPEYGYTFVPGALDKKAISAIFQVNPTYAADSNVI